MELAPVDRPCPVVLRALVPVQLVVGDGESEEVRLRYGDVDEFLPQLVVAEALDLPAHRLRSVLRVGIARTEHHERRPPPAVQRVLRHGALGVSALCEGQHDLEPLALVEALLLADAHHGARVRAVGAAADRDLVHDRRAVHQPADGADVCPGERRVVEDARVLGGARQQLLEHLGTRDSEGLGSTVEIHAVSALVLHLGDQHRLAFQARRARDPVALREHPDDLRVGVL